MPSVLQVATMTMGAKDSYLEYASAFVRWLQGDFDLALTKSFALTERVSVQFRAEGFDIFNHHNLYVNALNLDNANFGGGPVSVDALKGGLGTNAIGGNHDERRFGQFALRVTF